MSIQSNDIQNRLSNNKEQLYSCQDFIVTVKSMTNSSIFNICPYSQFQLAQIYKEVIDTFGVQTLTLDVILNFVYDIREKNKASLKEEVNYYWTQITSRLKEDIQKVSRRQLRKIIENYKGLEKERVLSEMLIQKSKSVEYVNCQKIISILKEVRDQIEQASTSSLTFEKLMNRRISQTQSQILQGHGSIEDILSNFRFSQKTQLQTFYSLWHRKMEYAYEFIRDEEVKDQIETFLQDVREQQNNMLEDLICLYAKIDQRTITCQQFDQINRQLNDQISLLDQVINEQKNQIQDGKSQQHKLQKQNRQIINESDLLNAAIQESKATLAKMSNQNYQIEQDLKDYKQRYNEIYTLYIKLAEQKNDQEIVKKKDEKSKIFIERTIKQQLDDQVHKFNKLLKQRTLERKVFAEEKETSAKQIQLRDAKIQQLESELRNRKDYLNFYIRNSKIQNYRGSIRNSHTSIRNTIKSHAYSGIFQPRSSIVMNSIQENVFKQETNEPHNSFKESNTASKIVIRLDESPQKKTLSPSKKKNIYIAAAKALPEIKQEDDLSHIAENALLPPQQNLTNVINSDNYLSKKQAETVWQSQTNSQVKANAVAKTQYFMSKGVLISVNGDKIQSTILLTQKRFCFFDSKLQLARYLPIQNIKSFIFCRTNLTLFIISPKNTLELDSSKHLITPLIFSIRNRPALIAYLTQKSLNIAKQHNIQLLTRSQDDIFVRFNGQQISIAHKIPNFNNTYRLALSHSPVFYGKVHQEGILNLKYDAIMVVQPIGLVCFEGTQVYETQEKRQFLFLFPFDQCKISQRKDSKEAPGRKIKMIYQSQTFQKYFNLFFNSKEDLKLFKKACEQQRKSNQNYRTSVYKSIQQIFKK